MVDPCFQGRIDRLRALLDASGTDGLLVSDPANVRYLVGFCGSWSRLVIGPTDTFLVVDRRYLDQTPELSGLCHLVCISGAEQVAGVREAILLSKARRLGFEPGSLAWWEQRALAARVPRSVILVAAGGQVEELRQVKEPGEIERIRQAAGATDLAIGSVLRAACIGGTEQELWASLALELRLRGGPPAFEPLVASGERTAVVHAKPTPRPLRSGDLFMVDAGATHDGYAADACRTVVVGAKPDPRQRHAFAAVREALDSAVAMLQPHTPIAQVELSAKTVLASHGYPLDHDIGHGVGLEIHEEPRVSEDAAGEVLPGMVIAIEPGVYAPGWGGVRLEETVLVTEAGPEVLTRLQLALAI